jgi:glycosyltransferase involved in cell wall biosynthesis
MKDGIEIIGIPRVHRWQRPRVWLTIIKHALKTNAAIYHYHDLELLLVSPIIRVISGKPIIYDIHEDNADFMEIKSDLPYLFRITVARLLRMLEPLIARFQNGLIFADDEIADNYKDINLPKTTLFNYPLRNFIEKGIIETGNNAVRYPNVIYLGSIKHERGSKLMIEAFELVLDQIPEARLSLVGPFTPKHHEQDIRNEIKNRDLLHAVTITGAVPYEEIGTYLQHAAIGWIPLPDHPKYNKNIPTKVFEYMAYRAAVVSSDLPPIRPFITHGINGYLVSPDDPSAHANAIIDLLRQPESAAEMGTQGQEIVKNNYSWDAMEDRLLSLYQQILLVKK